MKPKSVHGNHTFHTLPRTAWQRVAELLQTRVLKFFVKKKKLTVREAQQMLQWHHSGFNVHAGYRIQRDDQDSLEKLAQYILRLDTVLNLCEPEV